MTRVRPLWLLTMLACIFVALALARPVDHDESQYVAAAVLTAHGVLPYRDFAYLQTPLQPFVFAPIVWLAGAWTWPALRVANALLGAAAVAFVYRAARVGGAGERAALAGAGLFAACDILLFSIATARNDALPCALFAGALVLVMRAARGQATPGSAALAGALLAAAAVAKVSYALPAVAYGVIALFDRRHRPAWIAMGAAPVVAGVLALAALAPAGFRFGVFDFPVHAPAQYYRAAGRVVKLSWGAKAIDTLKFLALGPALLALAATSRFRWRAGNGRAIDGILLACVVAALLPFPTWRQYLLPVLPPLFIRLAIGWQVRAPGSAMRVALAVLVCAGLAPSIAAIAGSAPGMAAAARDGAAIRRAMDRAGVTGPIATLSPQFLPATGRLPDARFATGPFYFRSRGLLSPRDEAALHLVSRNRAFAAPAILVGGEGPWTSGDAALDAVLERGAVVRGYWRIAVPGGRFRLYVRPR